jgi:hypothetical protein
MFLLVRDRASHRQCLCPQGESAVRPVAENALAQRSPQRFATLFG